MKTQNYLILTIFTIFISTTLAFAREIPDGPYLGQAPPGKIPQIFAQGIVSLPDSDEMGVTFSPDGTEFSFQRNEKILYTKQEGENWLALTEASFIGNKTGEYGSPFFSPDNQSFLFVYGTSYRGQDIWICEREEEGWSQPVKLSECVNSDSREIGHSISLNRNLYLTSSRPGGNGNNGDIYFSKYVDGQYSPAVNLTFLNSAGADDGVFIAPDESYVLISSYLRPDTYGVFDIYVSFKKKVGNWTTCKNFGPSVNTGGYEFGAYVTPDDKYFMFVRDGDIFWTDAGIIDSLKTTNFCPYLLNNIPDTTAYLNELFQFKIPQNTFVDDDEDDVLQYVASKSNGKQLPDWLKFDSQTRTFSGTPTEAGRTTIKVTVFDHDSASAQDVFKINTPTTKVNEKKSGAVSSYLAQNFPNPFNPATTIKYNLQKSGHVKLKIFNLVGQELETVVESFQAAGEHEITWQPNGVASGIYFYKLQVGGSSETKKLILQK